MHVLLSSIVHPVNQGYVLTLGTVAPSVPIETSDVQPSAMGDVGTVMRLLETGCLFLATAIAEILGCYLPYLWLRDRAPAWVLAPAAASLVLFVWLLTLHPTTAGRIYAAYGGVYVATALAWLWAVDGVRPSAYDIAGSAVAILGMLIIMFAPRS